MPVLQPRCSLSYWPGVRLNRSFLSPSSPSPFLGLLANELEFISNFGAAHLIDHGNAKNAKVAMDWSFRDGQLRGKVLQFKNTLKITRWEASII